MAGRTATVTVTTPVQAVLDDAGHYTPAAPGKPVAVSFELAKVSGQWRISRLDDGLLIDQQDFEAAFRPYSIYFPDDTGSYLVPDLRWYPLTDGIATTLVQGLLAGPSRWLAPAVSTGAPTGTKLAEPAVVVAEGRAVVDLDEAVYKATSAQRKTLQRQLIETLSQVGGIGDVTVTVKRAAFNVTGAGAVPVDDDPGLRLKRDPKVAPNPLLLDRTGVLARLTGSGLNRTVEPVQQIVALSKRGGGAPAISSDGNAFAVLDHTGAAVWYQLAGAAQAQRLLTGRQLTPPSFDPRGWVWCTSRFSDRAVTAVRPDRDPARVAAAWLAGLQVRQLRVSRDGSRAVLIVLDAAGREQVLGTGIRRSADGSPLELTEPFRLAPELATVSAVAWLDESRVVLLGATAGGVLRTWLSQLGGPTLSTTEQADTEAAGQTEIKDANWIAAGNNQLELYLGTSSGKVLARAGRGWISVAEGRWPTFPG